MSTERNAHILAEVVIDLLDGSANYAEEMSADTGIPVKRCEEIRRILFAIGYGTGQVSLNTDLDLVLDKPGPVE